MPKKKHPYLTIGITLIIIGIIMWQQTTDQELLPEVQQQLTEIAPTTDIPVEQNGFIAMTGLSTAQSTNMISEGYKSLTETNKKLQADPFSFLIPLNLPSDLKMEQEYELPCNPNITDANCIKDIIAQRNTIEALIKHNQGLISNYLALQKFSKFAHIAPPQTNTTPPYIYVSQLSQLLTAQAIFDIKEGNIEQGMQFLLNDLRFYRNMLGSEKISLQESFLAINSLIRANMIINYLIDERIDLKPYLTELKPLLTPLSDQERNLTWTLNYEMLSHLVTISGLSREYFYTGDSPIGGCYKDSCSLSRIPSLLLYKFHGTLNTIYLDWQPMLNFAAKKPPLDDNFINQLKALKKIETAHHHTTASRLYERYGLFLLKNYTGEITKNKIYVGEGYTDVFIKLFVLNEVFKQTTQRLNTYADNLPTKPDEITEL